MARVMATSAAKSLCDPLINIFVVFLEPAAFTFAGPESNIRTTCALLCGLARQTLLEDVVQLLDTCCSSGNQS